MTWQQILYNSTGTLQNRKRKQSCRYFERMKNSIILTYNRFVSLATWINTICLHRGFWRRNKHMVPMQSLSLCNTDYTPCWIPMTLWKHCKNNSSLGSLQHRHCRLVRDSHEALSIHSYNLIATFQSSITGRSASREDSFDVDWQVAMGTPMPAHDTESQALGSSF